MCPIECHPYFISMSMNQQKEENYSETPYLPIKHMCILAIYNTFFKFQVQIREIFIIDILNLIMFAITEYVIKQRIEKSSQSADARSIESVENMNVNEKFLEVLKSSFEVKNLHEMNQLSKKKKKKKIKMTETRMDDLFQNVTSSTDTTFDDVIVLAIAYMNMGLIYVDCTEEKELYASKNHFMRCIELLKEKELERKAILTAIRARLELKSVLIRLKEPEVFDLLLDKAMELYLKYTKEENEYPDPINVPIIFGIEDEKNFLLSLDQLHLTTMDNLVNQYHFWPRDKDRLVIYVHNLLNRQIRETLKFEDIECYYWTLASLDLTQYFINNHRFTEARHHLAAADYVMEKFYKDKLVTINKTDSESLYAAMLNKYQHAHATIAKYWSSYGMTLLYLSKEKLCQKTDKSCKTESLMNSKEPENFLLFADLEKDLESISSKITDTYVSNLNDAKVIFVNVLRWLDIAKSYFTIEENLEQYGRIIIEISKAYKYFAYYEPTKVKQIKINKLQIEILENAIKELHPKAETSKEMEICKHIHFELGIAYCTFLDKKADKVNDCTEITTPDLQTLNIEMKQMVENAITHFTSYSNIL